MNFLSPILAVFTVFNVSTNMLKLQGPSGCVAFLPPNTQISLDLPVVFQNSTWNVYIAGTTTAVLANQVFKETNGYSLAYVFQQPPGLYLWEDVSYPQNLNFQLTQPEWTTEFDSLQTGWYYGLTCGCVGFICWVVKRGIHARVPWGPSS